jgi:hypothetical protein
MQVNLNPFMVDVEFSFVQGPPALAVAATAKFSGNKAAKSTATKAGAIRRIPRY